MNAPASNAKSNPLFNQNRLKLGIFAFNGSGGAMTTVPEQFQLTWPNTLDVAVEADQAEVYIESGTSALTRFASKVYLVHRRDSLRASKIMADRAVSHEKIQMVWDSVPVEVLGVPEGAVSGLKVRNLKTNAESVLPVKGIFVAMIVMNCTFESSERPAMKTMARATS